MASATSRTRARGAGFTLLEVLVALAIIGVVLLAALRGAMTLSNSARDARYKLLAILSAENRLHELRLSSPQLSVGVSRQDCDQAGLHLVCEQSVMATPNPFFRVVQVRALGADSGEERELASMTTVLGTTQ